MLVRSFESAANGMLSLIDMNDNTANNIANVNTTGYKKSELTFKNVMDAAVYHRNGTVLRGDSRHLGTISLGSQTMRMTRDFAQGACSKTGNKLDLAIEGDGFFKIEDRDGNTAYTRNGSFCLNKESFLVTKEGEYVLDNMDRRISVWNEDIALNDNMDIVITEDGLMELNDSNGVKFPLQTIGIWDFKDKENLFEVNSTRFLPKNADENPAIPAEKFCIQQGMLEMSNVSVIREMINTISTSRNYESLSKLVSTNSDMISTAISVGRIRT